MVQRQNEPVSLLWGKIPSDKEGFQELNSMHYSEVVEIHQLRSRFMVVLSDLRIFEFNITQTVRDQILSFLISKGPTNLFRSI